MKTLVAALLALGLALGPAGTWAADNALDTKEDRKQKKDKQDKKKGKEPADQSGGARQPRDVNGEISRLLRDLQLALEGGSAPSFLSLLDSAKFDDYPQFQDMVERLMREDTIRAYFGPLPASSTPAEGKVQAMVDAEMELSRRDAARPVQRRRRQLLLDFERTPRGWRITNITPRTYFEPL